MTVTNEVANSDYSNVPCDVINPERKNCRNNCDNGLAGDDLCGNGTFSLAQYCSGSDCSIMKRSK